MKSPELGRGGIGVVAGIFVWGLFIGGFGDVKLGEPTGTLF